MKLSIIIPTFNSSAVMSRALESIISQTFEDWEVLIMDGASTDNTIEIARTYNDKRIHIFSEPDKGIYDAMNKGIKNAQGEWLYFLGSDDWLLNNEVLLQVFAINIDDYDVVYGDVEAPQLAKENMGEWTLETIEYNRCHQAIFYKQSLFKTLGKYNLKYRILADHDMNLRWFFSSKIKSKYIPITIAHYSDGGISVQKRDEVFFDDFPYLLLKRAWKKIRIRKRIRLAKQAIKTSDMPFFNKMIIILWLVVMKITIKL